MKYFTSGLMAAVLISGIAGCQAPEDGNNRLLYNSDGTNIFMREPVPLSAGDVYRAVDEVAGTQVTTFLVCPNAGQNMYFPGASAPMLGEEDYEKIISGQFSVPEHLRNCAVKLRHRADDKGDFSRRRNELSRPGVKRIISFQLFLLPGNRSGSGFYCPW